jgi:hypothetical protein
MRRLTTRVRPFLFVLALPALGAAGCESTDAPTGSDTTTTPVAITDTFLGTVAVNGAATFSFGVNGSGAVTATYKSISPTPGSTMGLALGIWNGSSCGIVIANDNAILNTAVVGNSTAAGTLCVRAYDVGRLSATQTVELTITHF